MSLSGSLSFFQGEREVRVLELGAGHSESDVVVHLPKEKIVFCGDLFMNAMPPLPGEGHVTQTIAHYKAIEALEAEIYVAGQAIRDPWSTHAPSAPNWKASFSTPGNFSSRA
jgi:cyclase